MYLDFNSSIKQNTYRYDPTSVEKGEKVSEQASQSTDRENGAEPVKLPPNPNTLRALEAAGLPPSDKNITLVENMMQEGMRIDKANLQSMYRLLLKNPDVDSGQLVRMQNLGLEITDVSIRQFESYENRNHQILEGLDAISDAVFKESLALFEGGEGQGMSDSLQLMSNMIRIAEMPDSAGKVLADVPKWIDAGEQLEQILSTDNRTAVQAAMEMSSVSAQDKVGQVLELLDKLMQETNAADGMQGVSGQMPDQSTGQSVSGQNFEPAAGLGEQVGTLPDQPAKVIINEQTILNAPQGQQSEPLMAVKDVLQGLSEEISSPVQASSDTVRAADEQEIENTNGGSRTGESAPLSIRSEFLSGNARLVRELYADADKMRQLNPQSAAYKAVEADFLAKSEELKKAIGQSVKDTLFGSKGLMNQMRDRLLDEMTLKPEDVADDKKVEQFYEKLTAKMEQLGQSLSGAGLGQSQAAQSVMQMQDNVQFMNQLNQVYQYVQLPLKMFEQHTNGDLYVYTNKKHLADPDGNLSALLHLDMDHIGPLDVHVQLSGASRVTTHFYLQDEEMIDFIDENIHLLDERLTAKGYRVNSSVTTRQDKEEKSVIEHMMDHQAVNVRTKLLSVNSFDAKA